jgi:hypothetical protein
VFGFLRRSGRPGQPAGPAAAFPTAAFPTAAFPQQVTVQMPDGQLAHGQLIDQPGAGTGTNGSFHPTVVLVAPPALPPPRRPRRRWFQFVPRWARWTAVILIVGLFFRRIVAWAVLAVLSAGLHLFSASVHLPHVSFGWPWSTGTTTNTLVAPLVLQKIEGIDKPALGTATFDFSFTRTVNKSLGFLPCWYSATFAAVGRASATVDLNPGPAWWRPSTGHYQLQVLARPAGGAPGQVAITMALPLPQLPQSVHDVAIDNTLSKPTGVDHSWTYPGLGCGVLIQPQFAQSVLYSQAQTEAFQQATTVPRVTGPLIAAAEQQATTIIRDNFIIPTAGALNYRVSAFAIRWVPPSSRLVPATSR